MARRKSKRSPRKRNTAINLSNLAEAYIQTSIVSTAATGLSPWNFLMSKEDPSGSSKVTLNELLTNFNNIHTGTTMTEGELVWKNVNDNWMDAAVKLVGVGIGFRVANRMLRKPKAQLNKLARTIGLDMVRV